VRRAGLAAAVAILLVAGVVGVFAVGHTDSRGQPSTASTATTATPSTTSGPAVAGVEAFVPVAEKFIEDHRGLPFTKPVTVTVLGDADFRRRLAANQSANTDKAELDKTRNLLEALGLVPKGIDLEKAVQSLTGDTVVGFYDAKTKDLVVRGEQLTPYVREVIVHELTHAVQDQHFGIDRPELDKANDEQSTAFSALVEGDAVRVENEYVSSLSTAEQAQAKQEGEQRAVVPEVPEVLVDSLFFPYQVGPAFTEAIIQARGLRGLDAAFVHPPTTTEQVIHPSTYLAGQGPVAVVRPKADAAVTDHGVLGEYGIQLLLLPATDAKRLTSAQVAAAAAGWGGDQYVAWQRGGDTCVRDTFVMDTRADTNELVNALHIYASLRPGVTVTGTGPVTLTSCG
jgi:hypothetical protein